MKRKFFAAFLSLCMVISLVPMTALAAEESWTEVSTAEGLSSALVAGGNIKLTENITVTEAQAWTVGNGVNVVLDLNGYSITSTYNKANYYLFTVNGGSLTLNDSSETGTGKIEIQNASQSYPLQLRGTGSSFIMNGGTITATEDALDIYTFAQDTTITINGGTMSSQSYSTLAIRGTNTVVNINGGLIESNGSYGAFVSSGGSSDPDSIVFNMTGGKLTSTGTGILTDYALTVNIGGEAAIETTGTGISVKGTTVLNVDGGSITSGSYAIQANYNNTVNITGGEIQTTSTSAPAIQIGTNSNATISGGTITGEKVLAGNTEDITVTGGTFTDGETKVDVSTYFPAESLTQNEDGQVVPTDESVAIVDQIPYVTLQGAINAATNGETITLLKSTTLEEPLDSGTNTVLDLAGYTITAPDNAYIILVADGERFTLNDSSVNGTGALTGGVGDNSHAGAVTVQSGGSFTMNGGNIIDNTGTTKGAGVSLDSNSTFTMTGGSITDNASTVSIQSGVYANRQSTVTISGNVNITGNTGTDLGTKVNSDLWLDTLNGATLTIGEAGLDPNARIGVYVNGGVNDENNNVKAFTGAYQSGKATMENFISNRAKHYVVEVEVEGGVAAAMTLYPSAAPEASLVSGTYDGPQTVTLSTTTYPLLTSIYYTTDGSDPKTSDTAQKYTEPLTIETTTTIKAYTSGLRGDYVSSEVVTFTYTINPLCLVTFDANGGICDPSELTVPSGKEITLPELNSYGHNYFVGWRDQNGNEYAGGETVIITADTTFTAVWSYTPPANPNYKITIGAMENGTVTANPTAAKAGATVTLTPVPDEGYALSTLTVTDRFGDAVRVTENADGTYTFTMPNGQVTVTATFVETEEPVAEPFIDVAEGDWFYDAVVYAYQNELMNGVGGNRFAPNSETTRAQLVTILYRLEGEPTVSGDLPFTDVESGTWYTDAILWAAQNNIVNGVSDTEFAPGDEITRQQLVTILYRYAEAKGYDVSASADLSGYPDADQVQDYAQPAMAWAVAENIIQGMEDGTLKPAGNASRAQIATILMRFCEDVAQ